VALIVGGIAAAAVLVGFLWLTLVCSPFIIDDAFISFRYAENLARGHGLVFNPGERVEGYTNFLWVVMIAGVNMLGGDSLLWSKVLGVLANLATLVMVGLFALRWRPRLVFPGLALLPVLLLVTNYGFVLWGVGGLETPLFTCLATAGLLCLARAAANPGAASVDAKYDLATASRQEVGGVETSLLRYSGRGNGFYWAALLFSLAALTRPDATVLYAGGLLGWGLWALALGHPKRSVVGSWLVGVSIFVAVVWAHTLFRYLYYGEWVPNTVHIKAPTDVLFDIHWRALLDWLRSWGALDPHWLAPVDEVLPGLPDWWKSVVALVTAPGVLLVAVGLWGGWRLAWAWVLGAACGAWLFYLALIYPDWMPGWRYYQPILPVSVLLITAGMNSLLARARELRGDMLRRVASTALIAMAAVLVALSMGELKNRLPEIQSHIDTQKTYRAAGQYLRAHAPPGSILATIDSGSIPYYSGLYTIDYGGLADKHMALVPFRPATLDKGDGITRHYNSIRYDPEYLLGKHPDFVQLNGGVLSDGRLVIHYPELAILYRAMQKEGTYDLDNPIFFQAGQILVKRKNTGWIP
jgi:arabinofuranosyltransferase